MNHEFIEKNIGVMIVGVLFAISFGSLVELAPLIFSDTVSKPAKGLKPLTAIQLEGRDIFIREGCVGCHSQMIRPLVSETDRYGPYSTAGESVYNHPFLWGSKRTGPDLARVGGRYSDEWHRLHLYNPRDVVPESNMPAFPWLFEATLSGDDTPTKMRALQGLGVPYTDAQIAASAEAVKGVREVDALVSYLQQLGTVIRAQKQ